jgi:D-beta-D-heptose 7-phosphate kinase/D-beta-D-heptose 1-phosphate adenosyltransferase
MENTRIIWVNGCFDILHIGHVRMLEFAKSLGDKLIVGIDSDNRVKKSKGSERPINTQENRKEMLMSIKFVDDVVIFDSDSSLVEEISKSEACVIVVGLEYKDKGVIGSHLAEVEYFDRIGGFSTTSIVKNMDDLNI